MAPRRLIPLGALALLAVLAAGAAAEPAPATAPVRTRPAPAPRAIIDDEASMEDVDCQQFTGPAATSATHLTGSSRVSLDVLVLVDVADGARIAQIRDPRARTAALRHLFGRVRRSLHAGTESYASLGIDLRYDRYALLQPLVGGRPRVRTDNAAEIITLGKRQLGGRRPPQVDVVYVVTDMDIQLPLVGKNVVGLADCIGGVALADRSFAVGESGVLVGDDGIGFGPATFYKDLTAKIAAHEIGHLLGGHHHYQECGSAAGAAVRRGELGPCTVMTNFVDFLTMPFSTVNGVIVRGHAERWATHTDG